MTTYKCFSCNREVGDKYIKKHVRCIYCGAKIIFKARTQPITVKAR